MVGTTSTESEVKEPSPGPARWAVLTLVVAVVLGACSSPGSSGRATTTSGAAAAAAGRPVASPGCSAPTAAPVTEQSQSLTVDGVARSYLLTTPPAAARSGPLPVVVDLHGLGEGATIEALTTQFSPKAIADGFMAVFPVGTGTPIGWDINPSTSKHPNHDIDFMNALLTSLESHYCVDESRIYSTGLSDGALFTSLLACTMANRFAAFGPVAGAVVDKPCHPGRRVSIIAFHGTADPILYFNGGVGTAVLNNALSAKKVAVPALPVANLNGKGYPANVKEWAAKDGCNTRAADHKVSPHVILRTYRCPAGTNVEFYIVLGGGHAWPGSKLSAGLKAITGPSTFEVNATDLIWSFFEHHTLARPASARA